MSAPNIPVAHFFWEGALTNFQLLSYKSAHDAGFKVIVWSLTPHNLPDYVEGRDSREVLAPEDVQHLSMEYWGSPVHSQRALYSDFFRVAVVDTFGGWWFDSDVVVLKPAGEFEKLKQDRQLVAAFEDPVLSRVNNAVLAFGSKALASEYRSHMEHLRTNSPPVAQWAFYGPHALTMFLVPKGLLKDILPMSAVYPIPFSSATRMFSTTNPDKVFCEQAIKDSFVLHWWNSCVNAYVKSGKPPKGSFFADLFVKHGFNV